jgi:DNA repair exonuclease SbcCD ATPase subunit
MEHQEKLSAARQQLEKLDSEMSDVTAELSRLSRIQRTQPLIYRRKEYLERIKELGKVRELPESISDERKRALLTLDSVTISEQKLLDEKQLCEKEISELSVPEALIELEPGIMTLRDSLGAHKKAVQDLPTLQTRVATWTDEARSVLKELGRDVSLDNVEKLRVNSAVDARIKALAKERTKIDSELGRIQKDVKETEKKLRELERKYSQLPPQKESSSLRRIAIESRKQGDLEKQFRNLHLEISSLEDKAQGQLSALLLWKGSLEEVQRIPLPSIQTVDRFGKLFQNLEKEQEQVNLRKNGAVERLNELIEELRKLEAGGAVPTIEELYGIRGERDETWKRIRATWIENVQTDEIIPKKLAAAYEQKVSDADKIADSLWREAERTAKYSTLGAEREQREAEITGYDSQIDKLTKSTDAINGEWRMQWQTAGIDPLPPEEMKSWLTKHERLLESVNEWKERIRVSNALNEEIKKYRELCSAELLKLGESIAEENESLSNLLGRAEEIIEKLLKEDQERQQIARDIEKAESLLKDHHIELQRCQHALTKWKKGWGKAVKDIEFDEDASTEEVEAILMGLSRLFQKVSDIRKDQLRIDHINEDARQFSQEVAELVHKCAADLHNESPIKAASELIRRFDHGKENQKAMKTLVNRLKEIQKALAELRRDREAAEGVLKRLMQSAVCDNLEELEEAEKRSHEYRELAGKLTNLEDQMLNEGMPIEELVKQTESISPDLILGEIQMMENRASEIKKERDQRQVEIGRIQNAIDNMDGSRAAADAAAEAEEALASIKDNADKYVRLKLTALLLDKEIERYREKNQGPILQRAGEMFQRISLEAYTGLTTDFGTADQLIILCMRKNGDRVPVEGLSDGTRDQLYLCLRLSSLEQHVAKNEPFPLIIDDVLINFDDQRALATIELLGELSAKTQILFFTHHTKLLELSRNAVPEYLLKEHKL